MSSKIYILNLKKLSKFRLKVRTQIESGNVKMEGRDFSTGHFADLDLWMKFSLIITYADDIRSSIRAKLLSDLLFR